MAPSNVFAASCASWREIFNKLKSGKSCKHLRYKSFYGKTILRNGHGPHNAHLCKPLRSKPNHGKKSVSYTNARCRCTTQGRRSQRCTTKLGHVLWWHVLRASRKDQTGDGTIQRSVPVPTKAYVNKFCR